MSETKLYAYRYDDRPVRSYAGKGSLREHPNFRARSLGNRRKLIVYLPPSYYREEGRRYPVLYAHDGNNVFGTGTAFLGVDWGLDTTAEELTTAGRMEEIIIVGVSNTPDRAAEYTPSRGARIEGGKADLYGAFLIDDVKPFIDSHYRTRPEAEHTGLIGSSLGGLVSIYLGWQHAEVFGRICAMSVSVWWDHRVILDEVEANRQGPRNRKIWLDVGTLEGANADSDGDGVVDMVDDARDLRDLLMEQGFRMHENLEYFEDVGAPHNEWAWRQRAAAPMLFFWGTAPWDPKVGREVLCSR